MTVEKGTITIRAKSRRVMIKEYFDAIAGSDVWMRMIRNRVDISDVQPEGVYYIDENAIVSEIVDWIDDNARYLVFVKRDTELLSDVFFECENDAAKFILFWNDARR